MKSIIQTERECFICGSPYVEEHHLLCGINRKNSEKYGLKIYLCHKHHQDHKEGVHHNKDMMNGFQKLAQREFEKTHTREEFMQIFGRNYL